MMRHPMGNSGHLGIRKKPRVSLLTELLLHATDVEQAVCAVCDPLDATRSRRVGQSVALIPPRCMRCARMLRKVALI